MVEPEPILVVGGSGLLGEALQSELAARGRRSSAPTRRQLDLTDPRRVDAWLDRHRPAAVINAAAYSDVTRAERPDQCEQVFLLNRDAPADLALRCRRRGIAFVYISTDFVFDGTANRPYVEGDEPRPLQVYGRSKLAGERAVSRAHPESLIVRTSTLFGPGRRPRPHYVDAVLAQARKGGRVEVVRQPVSSPTFTSDLAAALVELVDRGSTGVLHLVNDGACSRLELARAAVRIVGFAERVEVVERPTPDDGPQRPAYSVLDTTELAARLGRRLRSWDEALAAYLAPRDG
ncbi:MAG TPA: dTDP-4-dehydrorhamnose reductase [Candidatus Polarisedimenticolaceae bacterium]|nr:dTDP-4-dehydrorhamnose reductase [Candidatus Polarisedimenticolaceae bacterium]